MGRKLLDQGTVFCVAGLVPIHGFIKGTGKFPIQKCAIFYKFKEFKGAEATHAAQAIP